MTTLDRGGQFDTSPLFPLTPLGIGTGRRSCWQYNEKPPSPSMNEFQKILDRRGQFDTSPFFPLAYLGTARAAALAGDTAKSRRAYQDFFALWKDADADIPILIEAKQKYEKLK